MKKKKIKDMINKFNIKKMIKSINIKEIITKQIHDHPIILLYILGNFINAILLVLFTTRHFQTRAFLINFGVVCLLAGISLLVKRKKLYYISTSALMIFICVVNSLYYNYYSSFVSISLLATSVFVKDVGDAVIQMVVRPCDFSYLWLVVALYIYYKKYMKKRDEKPIPKNYFFIYLVVAALTFFIGCTLPPYNSYSRLRKLWNRVVVVNSWGPYVYQVDDIVQCLKPKFNNIFGYDKALKDTKDYYLENEKEATTNEYTNIFEGKNVIVIHAESLQTFAMGINFHDRELTPNLNRLANEGIFFDNFYAQVGVGTSSDTEFTYATGLLPANNGTVFVNYFNNKYITMQSLLKDKGYYVFSMHGNVGDFWNRDTMHLNMGYDKFYSKSSFEIDEEYGLGLSDASFLRQAVPKIKEISDEVNKPFYGTLITLTNHTPWNGVEEYGDYDLSMTVDIDGEIVQRDYLETRMMGKYLKTVNYMDTAIGNFIRDMDAAGLLENTVIVIYGDHDARLGRKQFDYMYNYDPVTDTVRTEEDPEYVEFNEYDYELMRKVPFIIWSKNNKKGVRMDNPTGMIDVISTLGNMLGVRSKYALGRDAMSTSKEDAIVTFKDGSFITDKVYYNAKNGDVYAISNSVIEDDYIEKRSAYADKISEISDNIITYNLIKEMD